MARFCSKHTKRGTSHCFPDVRYHFIPFNNELSERGESKWRTSRLHTNFPVSWVNFSVLHLARVCFCWCVKQDIAQSSPTDVTMTVTIPPHTGLILFVAVILVAATLLMSRSTQKLQPIFPRLLQFVTNLFVPLHFIGSRAANYHYSLTGRAFFNTTVDTRSVKRLAPCKCRIQTAWHGVRFWSLSRTLWIECARSLQLPTSLFVCSRACPPIPALVHSHHSQYHLSSACFFFFFLTCQQGLLSVCKLVIWNSVPPSFIMWNNVPPSFVGLHWFSGRVFHLLPPVLVCSFVSKRCLCLLGEEFKKKDVASKPFLCTAVFQLLKEVWFFILHK